MTYNKEQRGVLGKRFQFSGSSRGDGYLLKYLKIYLSSIEPD